jgi:hypothetical protein
MSLDVYLQGPEKTCTCECSYCGNEHEFQRKPELYSANITHNLGRMADKAGIYGALWRPDEHGFTHAKQLIEPLRDGLKQLEENPTYFKQFDAENGWGRYIHFVPFVRAYLKACEQYPEATVHVSR